MELHDVDATIIFTIFSEITIFTFPTGVVCLADWSGLDPSCQSGKLAALLNSLFFLFKISFLHMYHVKYYDYIVNWCCLVIGVYISLDIAQLLALKPQHMQSSIWTCTEFSDWKRTVLQFALLIVIRACRLKVGGLVKRGVIGCVASNG